MRRLGNVFFPVSFDFNDTAEQLNLFDVIRQVTGRSNLVWGESVHVLEIHESL